MPKQNDWEAYINERIDFLTDHWTENDIEPYSFGGWREEVVTGMAKRIDEHIASTLKAHDNAIRQSVLDEVVEMIDPFDLVESCNPDCTPIEHAYHQGTWNAHLKLEKMLDDLKSQLTHQKEQ